MIKKYNQFIKEADEVQETPEGHELRMVYPSKFRD